MKLSYCNQFSESMKKQILKKKNKKNRDPLEILNFELVVWGILAQTWKGYGVCYTKKLRNVEI